MKAARFFGWKARLPSVSSAPILTSSFPLLTSSARACKHVAAS